MKDEAESKSALTRRPSGQGTTAAAATDSSPPFSTTNVEKPEAFVQISSVVQRLIAAERNAKDSADTTGRAAFRICDKLRGPLSSLIGVAGFRSLFSRALSLAKGDIPWLGGLEIGLDGVLGFPAEMQNQVDGNEAAQGGTALIGQLLGLLVTFIGEALTLRLVQNVWPKAVTIEPDAKENSHEKTA